jgi:hypothetical protein
MCNGKLKRISFENYLKCKQKAICILLTKEHLSICLISSGSLENESVPWKGYKNINYPLPRPSYLTNHSLQKFAIYPYFIICSLTVVQVCLEFLKFINLSAGKSINNVIICKEKDEGK